MKRFLTILLLVLSIDTFAQDISIKTGKFEIAIGGGVLLPVGKFASNSTEGFQQTVVSLGGFEEEISFFAKKNHGHAKRGSDFNFEVNYLTKRQWVHGIGLGKSSNTIDLSKADEFFTDKQFPMEIVFHEPYNISYLAYSIVHRFFVNNVEIRPFQKIGLSLIDFPFYNLQNIQWKISFIHEGERPKSNGIYFESGFVTIIPISSQLKLGLNLSYRYADYDFTMYKRGVPGGATTVVVHDQVNLRAIQTGIRLGYTFSRE